MYQRDSFPKHVLLSNLTTVKTENFHPIPVVENSRNSQEESQSSSCDFFESRMPAGLVSVNAQEKNNNSKTNVSYCNFCIKSQTKYNEKEYGEHLATHYDYLFKCSVCKYGFVTWNNAWKHVNNRHDEVKDKTVIIPQDAQRLLNATCRMKKCRRTFFAVNAEEMEQHFINQHWSSRKKINSCVEWSCRLCSNGGRRFSGQMEAFRHAELHVAGLIVTSREGEEDSDSTSGGFSSGYDCVSSEEGESDLSSVSERETEDSDNNNNEDSNRNEIETVTISP